MFMIDIAVPRDIEPGVNEIEGVYLYDIDSIQAIAESGRKRRERQIEQCHAIIDRVLDENPAIYAPLLCSPGDAGGCESGDETQPLPSS